jgi:hypothetical protein
MGNIWDWLFWFFLIPASLGIFLIGCLIVIGMAIWYFFKAARALYHYICISRKKKKEEDEVVEDERDTSFWFQCPRCGGKIRCLSLVEQPLCTSNLHSDTVAMELITIIEPQPIWNAIEIDQAHLGLTLAEQRFDNEEKLPHSRVPFTPEQALALLALRHCVQQRRTTGNQENGGEYQPV